MNRKEKQFIQTVWDFYDTRGRHTLPWRRQITPYRILVSEVMLQQTQVERVEPKYREFMRHFPSWKRLAHASLAEVLIAWQGLGYNRRAKMLHMCAQQISASSERAPLSTFRSLIQLPGVGPYTAGAVLVFAFNQPQVLIETNIRTVFLHHFFKKEHDVHDDQIVRYIERTLDRTNPREWYWALMDYGSYVKKKHGSLNHKSTHYTPQKPFRGSDRQIRGAILRVLSQCKGTRTHTHLLTSLTEFEERRIDEQLEKLCEEGLLQKAKQSYRLPR